MADAEIIPSYDELSAGQKLATDWWGGPAILADLARRIDEDREALACRTHRSCRREPDDCCTIGSVIGAWDKRWEAEAHRAEEAESMARALHDGVKRALRCEPPVDNDTLVRRVALLRDANDLASHANQFQSGEIAALRAALLATRDHEEDDAPCWCWRPEHTRGEHGPTCLQARAALAGCDLTPEPAP